MHKRAAGAVAVSLSGLLAGSVILSISPVVLAAKIYTWRDPDGVHFSQTPPPGQAAREIQTRKSAISSDEAAARLKALRAKAEQANKNRGLLERDRKAEKKVAERRTANCKVARRNLKILNDAGSRVQAEDRQGKKFYLTPETRQRKVEQTKSQIQQYCG